MPSSKVRIVDHAQVQLPADLSHREFFRKQEKTIINIAARVEIGPAENEEGSVRGIDSCTADGD